MLNSRFIKEEKYKLLATILVAGFFFYFWLEGPFQQTEPVLKLETSETEYSKPKLVRDQDNTSYGFGTVGEAETEGFGHGVMVDQPKQSRSSGMILDPSSDLIKSQEFGERLLLHANELTKKEGKLMATKDMFYIEIPGNPSLLYAESIGIVEGVRGYAGPVNVGVLFTSNGAIQSVHHVSSKETESYLKTIVKKGFYEQFEMLPLKGDHDVDAVSGATLTTEAIAKTTSQLAEVAMPEPLVTFADASEMDPFSVDAKLTWYWIVHISIIFLMFLYGFQKKLRKTKKAITILSVLSVVYIGFFLNNSFTYISFLHPFLGTSVSSLVGLYALFTLLGAIWGKNTYCKYVCPFGNAQRLLLQVTPKKMKSKFFISNKWVNRIRGGLAIVLIVGVLLGLRSWSNFELFPDLFGMEFMSMWFFGAVLTVLFTMRYPMIWCRLLCPTGSVLDFISDAVEVKKKKRRK